MRKISVFVIFLIAGIGYSVAAQTTVIDDSAEMDEINGVQYPIVGVRCSVNGRAGTLYNLGGLSNEEQQWYMGAGRILNCSLGLSVNECYCNLGAPDCFVGNTCGSAHIYDEDYSSSCTPPRVFSGRIVGSGNAPMGLPCNEIGVSCKCEVEKCHGFLPPNPDGTCPELPDDSENENAESGANVESNTATEPSNGTATAEQEQEGSPGCPEYTYRVKDGACLPGGGYMNAHIRGNIRWAGRKCTGDILWNYDPNATAGYWTQSIYGHHACPELGADDISGPYVRCACGSSQCKSGYTAVKGYCVPESANTTVDSLGVPPAPVQDTGDNNATDSNDDSPDVENEASDTVPRLHTPCSTEIITSGCWWRKSNSKWCAHANTCIDYQDGAEIDCCCAADTCAVEYQKVGPYCIPNNLYVTGMVSEYEDCDGDEASSWMRTQSNDTHDESTVPCVYIDSVDVENPYKIGECYCYVMSSVTMMNVTTESEAQPDDDISVLAKTLDEIEDAYGLSKWRTVDGKFNYARLASDATAAVVLGTTGALVTSSVVEKKQVEAGFESLECTVGGQHVGDWGDVFRIDGK